MAFEKNKERYASFGVTTSLPHEIIDTFWDLLDHYLKNVVPLDPILTFRLANNHNNVTLNITTANEKSSLVLITTSRLIPFSQKSYTLLTKQA